MALIDCINIMYIAGNWYECLIINGCKKVFQNAFLMIHFGGVFYFFGNENFKGDDKVIII